ncbi:MAG: fimbrial protein, partial [uncultured Gemmatimonadaceae bacterium]
VQQHQAQGLHADRAPHRRRDHRHPGRDRDPEVREHEGQGEARVGEVGRAQRDERDGGDLGRQQQPVHHHHADRRAVGPVARQRRHVDRADHGRLLAGRRQQLDHERYAEHLLGVGWRCRGFVGGRGRDHLRDWHGAGAGGYDSV